MIHAYDEMYVEGAMIRMGDMLEYACLDCGYDPDGFWRMFIQSSVAGGFGFGDPSIIAGRSGPELAYMVLSAMDHRESFPEPVWRESRSDLYWCGWALAYYQWYTVQSFQTLWGDISIRMMQKIYPTLHEADISKVVEELSKLQKPKKKKDVRFLRTIRGLTQKELADRAHMSISQIQRLEYGERKIDNLSLCSALGLAKALGVQIDELQ